MFRNELCVDNPNGPYGRTQIVPQQILQAIYNNRRDPGMFAKLIERPDRTFKDYRYTFCGHP